MKDIRPALRAFLLGDAGIVALVTTGGISRVYPIKLPQGTKTASIVYTRISGSSIYHMQGQSGLSMPRYQIDAWAPTGDAATALANLIKDRLSGYRGVMGSGGAAVTVQGVFMLDEREDYDDAVSMSRMSRDYAIDHEEI
ncbi:MAG: DUF3168 domain-containing protein [Afipia sp.]|nr:DUF3168 domain-containing protein [Afipia sp.]